jgi:hypothetical protein
MLISIPWFADTEKHLKRFITIIIMTILTMIPLQALEPEPVFLGTVTIIYGDATTDLEIDRRRETYDTLMIKISGSNCILEKMTIYFTDGSSEQVPGKTVFRRRTRTRFMPIETENAQITQVSFRARAIGKVNSMETEALFYGIYASD